MFMTFKALAEEQAKPLDYKIEAAFEAMDAGFSASKHQTAIAFSGGKDSTVLWHLQRMFFPKQTPYIIFGNTGVEYPESLQFARKLGREWGGDHFVEARPARTTRAGLKYEAQREVMQWLIDTGRIGEVLKPDGKLKSTDAMERQATPEMMADFERRGLIWKEDTVMSYWWCVDQYGFPILGKAASKLAARRINIDCFLRFSESESEKAELLAYYDMLRAIKISQMCCTILKKEPSERVQAQLDIDVIFKGLMAAESRTRKTNFCTRGYLFQSERDHLGDDPFFHCNPLSIWTDDDIWAYIRKFDAPYSPLYDMGFMDARGEYHTIKRNGCIGCATDIAYPNNHMSMLRRTHPKQWRAVMRAGMAKELQTMRIFKSNGKMSLFDFYSDIDDLMEQHPCIFDSINKLIMQDDTLAEFDAEFDAEVGA